MNGDKTRAEAHGYISGNYLILWGKPEKNEPGQLALSQRMTSEKYNFGIDAMKISLRFISILLSCVVVACINDGPPIYEKQLNGSYYLDAMDEYEEMSIGIQEGQTGVGVIKSTVFAVSQTNEFIIPLKQQLSKAIDGN